MVLVLLWLSVYCFQIFHNILSGGKDSYYFELVGVYHAVIFIVFVLVFSSCVRAYLNFVMLLQLVFAATLIILYANGFRIVEGTYFVPNASDAILYSDFAVKAVQVGWFSAADNFIEEYAIADLGASTYIYLIYLIFPDSPLSVYFVNLVFVLFLVFVLKNENESWYYRALRLSLVLNPYLFYLINTSFKELPMVFLVLSALRFFASGRWIMCALAFSFLIPFRPVLAVVFLASVFSVVFLGNLRLLLCRFSFNKNVLLVAPIILTFFVVFPFLLKFLESGLLATLDYYSDNSALSSYSIPVAFAASFVTGFFGPLYKSFSINGFSLGWLYSFFYPLGFILNGVSFYVIFVSRKLLPAKIIVIFVFILFGLLSVSVMLRGFDLRFTLVFYLSLWWLASSVPSQKFVIRNIRR